MDKFDNRLIKKFFQNTCTPEEAAIVLEWFETLEGKKFLEHKLDTDIEKIKKTNLHLADPDLDSEKIYRSIQEDFRSADTDFSARKTFLKPLWRVAAVLLIGLVGSVFYYNMYYEKTESSSVANAELKYFETNNNQQKKLTLVDGTKIKLNSNSQIWISSDFMQDSRVVRMEGEAFFDVASNTEKPFIINTDKASIKVLGTAFNVKSGVTKEELQVAVVEGNVSVSSTGAEEDKNSVILAGGQFGFLDNGEFGVENFGVENYLSWMKGRLVFEDLSLGQVCTQLSRIYEIDCKVMNESISDLKLSTNVSSVSSLEKVLSVISLSLDISYKKNSNQVLWFDKKIIESKRVEPKDVKRENE
ncbi:MAG: FecR domain-containing protein [Balneolaceae bacterium]|nr:FecR domain-containing protein [Balneolaceae bacterium]